MDRKKKDRETDTRGSIGMCVCMDVCFLAIAMLYVLHTSVLLPAKRPSPYIGP